MLKLLTPNFFIQSEKLLIPLLAILLPVVLGTGLYYAGVTFEKDGSFIVVKDLNGNEISNNTVLSVGINDYIPAVFDTYFPSTNSIKPLTDAETVINFLEQVNSQVNYGSSNNYFKY